jgi:HK97 family phage major capsid protein
MSDADTTAMEELKGLVATLNENVEEYRKGSVDRETVENIVAELVQAQAEAQPDRRALTAPDTDVERELHGKQGVERLALLQTLPAREVAPLVKTSVEDVVAFQEVCDKAVLLNAILGERDENPIELKDTRFYSNSFLPTLNAAMNTANAAEGAEFIPRELSPNLIDRVELTQKVIALFPAIPMPTNPFDIPGRPVARKKLAKGDEQVADTGQTGAKKVQIASRKIVLAAKKFWGEALVSKEAEEDAIIAMLGFIQSELVRYMGYDLEDAGINGDTAAAQDTQGGFYAADDPLRNWDGLRKLCPAGSKTDGANAKTAVAHLRANRKKMGVYGVDPTQLAHILSINSYIDLLDDTAVLTLEKYGANATILTGELGRVDNVPLIVSEAVHANLNAVGVVDGVTTNRTQALTVYRNGFATGQRRGLTVEVLRELYSEYDQDAVKVSQRRAFAALFPTATEKVVAMVYNLAT